MRPLKFLRRLKRKIKKYAHRYGYNPLRAIARERERMKFIHLGMRLARRQEPKTTLEIALQKPEVLHLPTGQWTRQYKQAKIEQSDTQRIDAVNAEQARILQQHLDAKRAEPPQQNTEPMRFHAIRLQHIHTEEMPVTLIGTFQTRETDKWTVL